MNWNHIDSLVVHRYLSKNSDQIVRMSTLMLVSAGQSNQKIHNLTLGII